MSARAMYSSLRSGKVSARWMVSTVQSTLERPAWIPERLSDPPPYGRP
jgi:hypothetical protein